MDRRTFLRTLAVTGSTVVAGCSSLLGGQSSTAPPIVEDRPDGVYIPGHVEGMRMEGTAERDGYGFALMYSYPHRFWNVNGESTSLTQIGDDDDVHLMASVWDPETGTVLPETGLSAEIYQDGDLVSQETIYPMLSQPMGFHYGANFGLAGDGTYDVRLSVGGMTIRRTGDFRDRFAEPTTAEIPLEYSESARNEIPFETLSDAGSRGALEPRAMDAVPRSTALAPEDLPGRVVGTERTDDAVFVVTVLESPPEGVSDDGRYLAVSARSAYNRMVLPAMGLSTRLDRDGEAIYDGSLTRTLDSDLGYHYGAVVDSVQSGDELTIAVDLQPQTARHEGYETAFGGVTGPMEDRTLTVE